MPESTFDPDSVSLGFRPKHRLTHALEFQRVYEAKMRKIKGAMVVFSAPNELGHPRLGLSVSSRVGPAVVRNRWKRRIREAFRLSQHDLPAGFDFIVSVRCGPDTRPWGLPEITARLREMAVDSQREWQRRQKPPGGGGIGGVVGAQP